MLQAVDIAVAFAAAWSRAARRSWAPADIRRDLDLPWSSINQSLGRLDKAGLVRIGRANRAGLAALLPALPYIVPLEVDRSQSVLGIPTAGSAPAFQGRLVQPTPLVWPADHAAVVGYPVRPLHPRIPEAVARNEDLHAVMASLDAARSGRAREFAIASELLERLVELPPAVKVA